MTPNDVKIVADNIDDFIEVPDGINRLRKAVLTLAISGKLVQQDKKEGEANDLFAQIQKAQSNSPKKRQRKINTVLTPSDTPFDIPNTWLWVRLGDLGHTETGSTPKQTSKRFSEGVIPFVRPDNIKNLCISGVRDNITKVDLENGGTLMPKDSVLMVCIGSIGKVGVADQDVSFNQQINAISLYKDILPEYILYASASGYFQEFAWKLSSKTTLPILNKSKWESIPVPLPPHAEQTRIVKKVEEVMKQLDELEAKKRERDETRTRLARSAMQSLGKGESKIAFEQLSELVKTPADIKELEGALLTLAVSGKLVPQDKKEGTADDLCVKIKERHTRAVDSGTLRKKSGKDVLPVTVEETPFDIPKSWKWVKLNDIGTTNIGLTYSPNDIAKIGTPVLRSSNVQNDQIDLRDLVRVKKDIKSSVLVNDGDLLICARNGSKALVGKTAMIRNLDEKMAFGAFMALYRSECNSYVEIFLKSPIYRNLLDGVSTTTINQITQDNLKNTLIPLPPFGEQKRIVKKVEEVMSLINKLRDVIGKNVTGTRGRPKK